MEESACLLPVNFGFFLKCQAVSEKKIDLYIHHPHLGVGELGEGPGQEVAEGEIVEGQLDV